MNNMFDGIKTLKNIGYEFVFEDNVHIVFMKSWCFTRIIITKWDGDFTVSKHCRYGGVSPFEYEELLAIQKLLETLDKQAHENFYVTSKSAYVEELKDIGFL